MMIPKRLLGGTGVEVTILGLGGEGILRTYGHEEEASALIHRALDLGITYFESARAYSGSESYYGLALKERRKEIFLTSKSHARDRVGAWQHLYETLKNMGTDYLDLWQVHDVRTGAEVEEIFGPKGAIEAFIKAKEKGLVRFIGVTGHHDPFITRGCLELYDFDTVLIPINPAEPPHLGFPDVVIPFAREKGTAVIAMKTYLKGFVSRLPGFQGFEPFFRFALTRGATTAVIGCDDIHQLDNNVSIASRFEPLSQEEEKGVVEWVSPNASQLMFYKP